MSQDWAEKTAEQLLSRDLIQTGICLILGASDTGKTTLAAAFAKRLADRHIVGIVDADIGQSHIGPPATVGWTIIENEQSTVLRTPCGGQLTPFDFSQLPAGGISFVGDITPVGHLLQFTAAILQCVEQASKTATLIIIDTPGFINGSAATALWWDVQRLLQPKLILAVQKNTELSEILVGLQSFDLRIERIKSPPQIPFKSPQQRQKYRKEQFSKYFRDPCIYNISLSKVAVQTGRNLNSDSLTNRLIALRDEKGVDIAIGTITSWQDDKGIAIVKTPKIDINQIRCVVIGDITIDTDG
jgi:polynucleotide 5'-hydroxyl-kinase GRC3/NOL9